MRKTYMKIIIIIMHISIRILWKRVKVIKYVV